MFNAPSAKVLVPVSLVVVFVGLALVFWNKTDRATPTLDQQAASNRVVDRLPSTAPAGKAVQPVSACRVLTAEKVRTVYSKKEFKTETDRNDEPNIYEALSACRYASVESSPFDVYYVDLEVRAQQNVQEAERFYQGKVDTDYDQRGRTIENIGDKAYFLQLPMTSGGPRLVFVKGSVVYQLSIQTFAKTEQATLEKELLALAKQVLQ